jgi:peptidoglycan/xylan/chitin deacetylase (PgdA/CDA1 family)
MKIRRQDLGVLFFYFLGYSRIRSLIFRLQRRPITRILLFHDILPEAYNYFRANISALKQGTNVVSLDDYFSGRLTTKKLNVVISFDDGYKSWVKIALPILKELKLPATFFVTSGFVGLSKEAEATFVQSNLSLTMGPRTISGGLSTEELSKLIEEGFSIGGHTLNHCNLGKLHDNAQVRYEILEDKKRLERIAGSRVEYFAYPSGADYNPTVDLVSILIESGYKGAVTTAPGFNTDKSNPFLLHREITGALMPGLVFRARAYGNYDAVRFLKERLQKVFQ